MTAGGGNDQAPTTLLLKNNNTELLAGDTIDRHALRKGRQNTLVEIRNDLIATEAGQIEWAERLAKLLPQALELAEAGKGV